MPERRDRGIGLPRCERHDFHLGEPVFLIQRKGDVRGSSGGTKTREGSPGGGGNVNLLPLEPAGKKTDIDSRQRQRDSQKKPLLSRHKTFILNIHCTLVRFIV